jgi:hypothetical protein
MVNIALIAVLTALLSTSGGPSENSANEPGESKLICKTHVTTGSRLATERRCLTREDWDRARREAAEALSGRRNRPVEPAR